MGDGNEVTIRVRAVDDTDTARRDTRRKWESEPPIRLPVQATDPIDDAWRAKVRSEIRAMGKDTLNIPLGVDSAEFRAEIAGNLAAVKSFAHEEIPINLADADTFRASVEELIVSTKAQITAAKPVMPITAADPINDAFIAKVKASLRSLSRDSLQIPVTPDTAAYRADLDARLKAVAEVTKQSVPVEPGDAAVYRAKVTRLLEETKASVKQSIPLTADEGSARQAGQQAAGLFGGGLRGGLPAAIAGSLPLLVPLGAAAGAALGVAAIGALAVTLHSNELSDAWHTLVTTAHNELAGLSAQVTPPVQQALGALTQLVKQEAPQFSQAFKGVAADVPAIVQALEGGLQPAIQGTATMLANSRPLVQAVGAVFTALGNVFGQTATYIGQHSAQIGVVVTGVAHTVNDLAPVITHVVDAAVQLGTVAAPALDLFAKALGPVSTLLDGFTTGVGRFEQGTADAITGVGNWLDQLSGSRPAYQMFEEQIGRTNLGLTKGIDAISGYGAASTDFTSKVLTAAQAVQSIKDHFTQADQAVASAQNSLADANHSYQSSVSAVADAEHSVTTAMRGVADAEHNVTNAQDQYNQALDQEKTAQQGVADARRAAAQQLVDLALQANDAAASALGANVSLFDAQQAAAALGVNPGNAQAIASEQVTAANEAQVKAAIALIEAENQVADSQDNSSKAATALATARKQGVDGSPQVLAAERQLASATVGVTNAQYSLRQAQLQVTDAEYAVRQAHRSVSDAMWAEHDASTALATARMGLKTAIDADSRSTDISTAAGQRNQQLILNLANTLKATGIPPTQQYNTLINDTARYFDISRGKAAGYLAQIGAIPKNYQFAVHGVADVQTNLGGFFSAIQQELAVSKGVKRAAGGPIHGPGSGTSDDVLMWGSNGEHVWTADEVRKAGGHGAVESLRRSVRGYAAGGSVGDMVGAVANGATLGGLYEARNNVNRVMGFPTVPDLPPYVPPPAIQYAAGAGVSQWAGVILQALGLAGQSGAWLGTVEHRMQQESGGNPTIVNRWDSNWARGTPSVGLMQPIGPTFAAYAGQFRNTGPFEYGVSVDPLANTYTGVNYAMHRYGSLSALNRAGGYAGGGVASGWSIINEHGGEAVKLPTGSTVMPAANTPTVSGGEVKVTFAFDHARGGSMDVAMGNYLMDLLRTGKIRIQSQWIQN